MPKNDFGNIDLYVPTMLPAGAVHVPCESIVSYCFCPSLSPQIINQLCRRATGADGSFFGYVCFSDKGTAKLARQLKFDYAEAVVCV